MVSHQTGLSFEDFQEEWVSEIDLEPTTHDKGRAFVTKLVFEWLDIEEDEEDFYYVDSSGDGGIDAAYWEKPMEPQNTDDEDSAGDIWYVIQSKYGTSLSGPQDIARESEKLFDTLMGRNESLSNTAQHVVNKLRNFMRRSSTNDKLVFVVATSDPLDDVEIAAVERAREAGKAELRDADLAFDVQAVSVMNIYENIMARHESLQLSLRGSLSESVSRTYVGTVSLYDMYAFLKEFRTKTAGDIDRLYERNIRRWLGKKNRVNHEIKNTILGQPEMFGVYNNGVTFVASELSPVDGTSWSIVNPYIVNGCQTTRTLFDVLDEKMSGGSGYDAQLADWDSKIRSGRVVVKVVLSDDKVEIENITRFTNLQSAVYNRDFVALNEEFVGWQKELQSEHGRYLEIQRGGWDSFKALNRSRLRAGSKPVKANEMIKVFGAGWLGYAGTAGRRSEDFLPSGQSGKDSGKVYSEIVELQDFGAKDFLAAEALFDKGKQAGFGARNSGIRRAHTKFLFYFTYIQLLRAILAVSGDPANVPSDNLSRATWHLHREEINNQGGTGIFNSLCNNAVKVIDNYFTPSLDGTIPNDLDLEHAGTNDVKDFLQSTRLDKVNLNKTAQGYNRVLGSMINALEIDVGGGTTPLQTYRSALSDELVSE